MIALSPLSQAIAKTVRPSMGLSLLLFALPTFAEDKPENDQLDTITVTASALKVATPLAETPRSVSVIDEEQLSIQQPKKLDEALRYQPGVLTQPYGSDNDQDWFKIRGFDAATYLDGNRLYNVGYYNWTLEPFGLEQVEVLKGPSAILYGEAPPGGVINAVSKRPGYTEGGMLQLQAGTNNQQQIGIDVTSFVDDDGDVRFRLVGMMSERDGMLDDTYTDRVYLAPSLAWDISPDTSITFLASYKKDDGVPTNPFKPAYGTLIDTPEGKLDPSTNLGEPGYDKNENTQLSLAYELEHHFNDVWQFKQNTRYAHTDLLLRSTYAFGSETSADLARGIVYRDGTTDSYSMDNQAIANWSTDRTENTFLFGVDLQHYNNDSMEADDWGVNYGGTTGNINAFDPVYGNYQPIDDRATLVDITKGQAGFYAQQQVKLDDKWIMKVGGRYDIVRLQNDSGSTQEDIHNTNLALSGGLMYQTDFGFTPYISYDESFEVLASVDAATGKAYKPLEGQQTEAGFKYEPSFINGYINMAWFNINQKNGLVYDPSTAQQTQTQELTSQGVEIEGVANVTQDLLVRANYTYTDARSDDGLGNEQRTPLIPRHMASTWLEYDFSHLGLDSFIIGAGARYMGSSVGHTSDGAGTLQVPSVTLFDAMARYDITQKWRAQVNVNNLTNKEYVASCDYYCYYGEEMSATATINYLW
ncbi:TonB-dependent siderophore receptor [Vibrio rumoiensis]|uniref:Ligand-gated channel n=1 Tax=Vibrio rumoiensis 1S-45 TaxID=1188252 RepID=A0A1E5E0R5_9VIBR|nr:TonB-dependent siderophore receptor [Vibrio rumoiensis]OEF23665.1 ligand-gated channel [Vibrio rumoiensis 1S-45]